MKIKFFLFVFLFFQISLVLAIQPFGVEAGGFNEIKSERAPADTAISHEAIAGNVTEINIQGFTTTQTWQGYFGNVSGTIQLADALDNVMYNWSLASPQGEIYATVDTSVNWSGIACFNLTNDHIALEEAYNITSDDVDGVNETFSDAGTHDMFYTNNIQFTAGQCASTSIYDSTGASVDNNFEEVLMYDGQDVTEPIFASILDEEDVAGFDGKYHDFEMLVLEDGHGTDTDTSTYYFYVELE